MHHEPIEGESNRMSAAGQVCRSVCGVDLLESGGDAKPEKYRQSEVTPLIYGDGAREDEAVNVRYGLSWISIY